MSIDLLLTLIEKCKDWAGLKEKMLKDRFDDHVVPVSNAVEAVHKDYMSSFRVYKEEILKNGVSAAVVEQIANDSRFSRHLRSGLRQSGFALYEMDDSDKVVSFLQSIGHYLLIANADVHDELTENASRQGLLFLLRRLRNGEVADIRDGQMLITYDDFAFVNEAINRLSTDKHTESSDEEIEKVVAVAAIDSIVDRLQDNHEIVNARYLTLKSSFK